MMKIINGPIVPMTAGSVIYQVTLASGMIVTNPAAFGVIEHNKVEQQIIVTEDGRVLITPVKINEPTPTNP